MITRNTTPGKSSSEAAKTQTDRMPLTMNGIIFLIVGTIVMAIGYALMTGGGSDDPNVFNYAMFDFRRTVLSPIVILLGVGVDICAIMGVFDKIKLPKK